MLATLATATLALAVQGDGIPPGPDWVIPAGNFFYDTSDGIVRVNTMTVMPGAHLRIDGPLPFVVIAKTSITIDGTIQASGFDAKQVGSLFMPFLPETGAAGGAGGGQGGMGSPNTTSSSPKGGDGELAWPAPADKFRGGRGGEAGHSASPDKQQRRGAGGGGGAFGPDVIGGGPGFVATKGSDGHPLGIGAITGTSPPLGGDTNVRPFVDGNPLNDFWGRKLDSASGVVIVGELAVPRAGVGAGAGGDAIQNGTFPTLPFGPPYKDKKGAGAGGGGSLVGLIAPRISMGQEGRLLLDGGDGATGENVLGFDHIGGSSGGGSGGMAVIEASVLLDLSQASDNAMSAIGGIGGIGKGPEVWSQGGNGGPGLLQVHLSSTANLLLPTGKNLADLTQPDAHVLLPEFF